MIRLIYIYCFLYSTAWVLEHIINFTYACKLCSQTVIITNLYRLQSINVCVHIHSGGPDFFLRGASATPLLFANQLVKFFLKTFKS